MDQTADARAAALFRLFEYTGALGNLPLPVAIATYRTLRAGRHDWAVGPFALSVTQLGAFAENADEEAFNWPLAVVLDYPDNEWLAGIRAGVSAFQTFSARHNANIRYFCTTMPEGSAARHAIDASLATFGDVPVYFETTIADPQKMRSNVDNVYAAIDRAGPKARITVALTAATTAQHLTDFLTEIRDAPIRCRFTSVSPTAMTNGDSIGFINLIAAYLFGADPDLAKAILDERSPQEISLGKNGLAIGETIASVEDLTHMRWSQFTSLATPSVDVALSQLIDIGAILA